MNLLTSDRILKKYRGSLPVNFESLFVVFWLFMVSKPWSHGCHLGIALKDFLNPFACEGHNSFVENLLSTGAQRYVFDHSLYKRNCHSSLSVSAADFKR